MITTYPLTAEDEALIGAGLDAKRRNRSSVAASLGGGEDRIRTCEPV